MNYKLILESIAEVTEEQINRCQRILGPEGIFYLVRSETDDLTEYKVEWRTFTSSGKPVKRFTCTCPAGLNGFAYVRNKTGVCKHIRWCVAHAQWYKNNASDHILQAERIATEAAKKAILRDLGHEGKHHSFTLKDLQNIRHAERRPRKQQSEEEWKRVTERENARQQAWLAELKFLDEFHR